MKQLIILCVILISAASVFAQSPLTAGDTCFDSGDYVCAQAKYQEAMNTSTGRDKQLAEIKYTQAKSCGDWLADAEQAFRNKDYQEAKENYQSVLNENPKDSYAQEQLEKCDTAIKDNMTLKVSKESITFKSAGGVESIGVQTNAPSYTIVEYPSWCTLQASSTYFEISYPANTGTVARTGVFKIKAGNKEVQIHVNQPPPPKKPEITLSVSKESLSFSEEKNYIRVDVNTNASDYQITNLPWWCSVMSKNSSWFHLECDANYSAFSRDGSFNITAGDKNVKINLHQVGAKSNQKNIINTKYRPRTSDYSFFAIGYEGGQIAKYGFRMEFGGRKFIGMFLNVRSTVISDEEILKNYGFLENKNEGIIGFNFRLARIAYLNLGGGYGYYKVPLTNTTLEQVEYYPVYGGLTFRLGRRINLSGGASFRDIEANFDTGSYDPEFTLGLTINLKR